MFSALVVGACGDSGTTSGGGGSDGTGGANTGGSTTNTGGSTTTGTTANNCDNGGTYDPSYVCTTYGAAVPTVVSNLVDSAAGDPKFQADFAPLVAEGQPAVDAFKASLTAFISDAYGCTTGTYTGPSMVDAHASTPIDKAHYDDFLGLIVTTLSDAGVPEDDITNCFAPPLLDTGDLAKSIINE